MWAKQVELPGHVCSWRGLCPDIHVLCFVSSCFIFLSWNNSPWSRGVDGDFQISTLPRMKQSGPGVLPSHVCEAGVCLSCWVCQGFPCSLLFSLQQASAPCLLFSVFLFQISSGTGWGRRWAPWTAHASQPLQAQLVPSSQSAWPL